MAGNLWHSAVRHGTHVQRSARATVTRHRTLFHSIPFVSGEEHREQWVGRGYKKTQSIATVVGLWTCFGAPESRHLTHMISPWLTGSQAIAFTAKVNTNTHYGRLIQRKRAMAEAFGSHEGRCDIITLLATSSRKPKRQGRVFFLSAFFIPCNLKSPLVDLIYFMRSQAWDAQCVRSDSHCLSRHPRK